MALAGFSGRLGDFARRFQPLPQWFVAEAEALLRAELQTTFDSGADPYGNTWQPKKDGNTATLVDTGALRGSLKTSVSADGSLDFDYDDPVAGYHQGGTWKMPTRPILPIEGEGLPPHWTAVLDELWKTLCDEAGQ